MKFNTLIPLALLAASGASAQPAVTIYNGNFGVVRDTVSLELEKGLNEASYSGVTTQLEPESVVLRDPSGVVDLSVVEQSYRGDPVDQTRLLQLFEGQTIQFLKVLDGREVVVDGTILRAPGQVMQKNSRGNSYQTTLQPIVQVEGRLMTQLPGTPLFPALGDDSVLLPTLSWKLHSSAATNLDAQLSYLTYGMSWKADYNLVLPEVGDELALTGWVSLENNTGRSFDDAKIKLMAGDVNKVVQGGAVDPFARRSVALASVVADESYAVEEKKFDEFHMYSLPLPTTLRDRETKQVEFVRAEAVQTSKLYVYDGFPGYRLGGLNVNQNYGQNSQPDVAIYREFKNSEENGLGVPLPAGRTRFYRMDSDGQLEFTGENTIDHTPKNEQVRVYLGNAFDLVGERTRTDFTKHRSQDQMTESFAIEIRNRSDEAVTVQVVEHLYRWVNWELLQHSHAYTKTDAQTIEFPVTVEPDATVTVSYTVEYAW